MLSKHDFSLDNFLQSKMSGNVLVCGEMKSHFLFGGEVPSSLSAMDLTISGVQLATGATSASERRKAHISSLCCEHLSIAQKLMSYVKVAVGSQRTLIVYQGLQKNFTEPWERSMFLSRGKDITILCCPVQDKS